MSLKEKTVSGVKWNTLATANNAIVQIAKLMILARLLPKSDFGLIAIVLMLVGFFDIFANLGLSVGIIHKANISKAQYSSVFWINLLASILLYFILCFCSLFFEKFYHQENLGELIILMGLQLIINAFGKLFFTLKTKELEFKFISVVNMIGIYTGSMITIILAFFGYGVYSLVYGLLLQSLIIQGTYAVSGMKKYKILFRINIKEIYDILKIGGYQVGTQILDYFSNKFDIFLIGKFFGMELLGVYNLGKELTIKLLQLINPVITNVATPAFSKIQQNLPLIQTTYLRILKILSFINFPIFIALFIFADPITILVYGVEMMEIAPFVRILSLWALLNSVANPAGILMVSLGRTDLGFHWTIVRILISSVVILFSCFFSIYIVAWSQVIIAFLFFFLYWRLMIFKISQIPLSDYIKVNVPAFFLSIMAGIPTAFLFLFIEKIYWQCAVIILFYCLYILFHFLFNNKFLREILLLVFPKYFNKLNIN